jgi:GT2 family glycosyltransferase
MQYPKTVISILNFNGRNDTAKCLKSLLKTNYPNFKIIVADNGSKINESKLLKKDFRDKRIKFVRFNKNYGFTGGNNRVLKMVKEKYLVLLNNDTTVSPSWLKKLIIFLEKYPDVAIVQPKILSLNNKKSFDYAGACGGYIDILGYPFTRGRVFNTHEDDNGQYNSTADIFWSSGAAMTIRTSVLKKVGFLDERFFNYMEEIDLCFRVHGAGYRIVCYPKSVVFHKGGATASKNILKKRFWEHRNNILLIIKNYPNHILFFILPIRLLLEYLSVFYYLISRQHTFALSVLLSQISLIYNIPYILTKRKENKRLNSKKRKIKLVNKSIVFDYFILKKKTFSKIYPQQ